jgi:MFS superfamily sulfate permease-like transporter
MNWGDLARKFVCGFRKSNLSQKGMGVTDSEAVRLREMIRKSGYEGSLAFFICKKVNEEFFDCDDKKRKMIKLLRKINLDTPSDDELVDAFAQIKSEIGSIDCVISAKKDQNEAVDFCRKFQELQMSI